ncbi:EamA family transporter [Prosthecodimorpha staleyi]|uniref:EamA family transporter n=1 Tax=Prosthecodimorpha staleyi TaxID=2840188 RepID=A0A947D5B6_9HYPH|nr:EamA family transporter [Prosthecodimorpha staleyi]MBT9288462.1 EamA family transporter [Prosthecodimorpha staleyi]
MMAYLWILFTIVASGGQTLRNALQRDLIAEVGTVGATHVRFLYGLPFGCLFLLIISTVSGTALPVPTGGFWLWTLGGALAQILATGLMLQAMKSKSFLVTIAYTKTEPVQVAIFGILFLSEVPSPMLAGAIVVATAGVMIMSWPKASADGAARDWTPAILGTVSGGLFGLAAVCFKGGIQSLGLPNFLVAASATLAAGLGLQTLILTGYLIATDRAALIKLFRAWRPSVLAGFLGAFASQCWFAAFALEPVAHVRTLGLVEILFSLAVSHRLMSQITSPREGFGIALLVVGVLVVLNA